MKMRAVRLRFEQRFQVQEKKKKKNNEKQMEEEEKKKQHEEERPLDETLQVNSERMNGSVGKSGLTLTLRT